MNQKRVFSLKKRRKPKDNNERRKEKNTQKKQINSIDEEGKSTSLEIKYYRLSLVSCMCVVFKWREIRL